MFGTKLKFKLVYRDGNKKNSLNDRFSADNCIFYLQNWQNECISVLGAGCIWIFWGGGGGGINNPPQKKFHLSPPFFFGEGTGRPPLPTPAPPPIPLCLFPWR